MFSHFSLRGFEPRGEKRKAEARSDAGSEERREERGERREEMLFTCEVDAQ